MNWLNFQKIITKLNFFRPKFFFGKNKKSVKNTYATFFYFSRIFFRMNTFKWYKQIQFIVESRGAYKGDLNIENDTID